jgi:hypothetical protein
MKTLLFEKDSHMEFTLNRPHWLMPAHAMRNRINS